MVFIRAPYIVSVSGKTEVLATIDERIVAAREGNMLVTSFHRNLPIIFLFTAISSIRWLDRICRIKTVFFHHSKNLFTRFLEFLFYLIFLHKILLPFTI